MTTYETGATSHAVNELILFTDNTPLLVDLRDAIYGEWGRTSELTKERFTPLFEAARRHYINDMQSVIKMSKDEISEYCQLYANNYTNWLKR